jgi:hypothetical protein
MRSKVKLNLCEIPPLAALSLVICKRSEVSAPSLFSLLPLPEQRQQGLPGPGGRLVLAVDAGRFYEFQRCNTIWFSISFARWLAFCKASSSKRRVSA